MPVIGRWRQEDEEFRVILCCIVSSRLAWLPVSKNNNSNNKNEPFPIVTQGLPEIPGELMRGPAPFPQFSVSKNDTLSILET